MVVVPDASVLLKWVLQSDEEPDRRQAQALKDAWLNESCDLVVPSLWSFEVGNVLGQKRPVAAEALLQAMVDLGLRESPPHGYLRAIVALMRQYRVTFYDAAYHALAIHLRGTMITADAAYVRKAGGAGQVALLRDWHP